MNQNDLPESYNYDEFVPAKFRPWLNFDKSPSLGEPAPDFPLFTLEGAETSLSAVWKQNLYTMVEFGSFT